MTAAALGGAVLWYGIGTPALREIPASAAKLVAGATAFALGSTSEAGAIASLAFFAGTLAGARAPDWLEIASWTWAGERVSVIPHRTVTHWPWPWLAALAAALAVASGPGRGAQTFAYLALSGFAAAGLLHIALDAMSPAGVPLRHPFGKRSSLAVYRSGAPSELLVVMGMAGAAFATAWFAAWITAPA